MSLVYPSEQATLQEFSYASLTGFMSSTIASVKISKSHFKSYKDNKRQCYEIIPLKSCVFRSVIVILPLYAPIFFEGTGSKAASCQPAFVNRTLSERLTIVTANKRQLVLHFYNFHIQKEAKIRTVQGVDLYSLQSVRLIRVEDNPNRRSLLADDHLGFLHPEPGMHVWKDAFRVRVVWLFAENQHIRKIKIKILQRKFRKPVQFNLRLVVHMILELLLLQHLLDHRHNVFVDHF